MECDFYFGSTINIARVEEMVISPVRGKPTRREETRAATNEGEGRGGRVVLVDVPFKMPCVIEYPPRLMQRS